MLLLKLDERSRRPLFRQIIDRIREKIEARVLGPGDKLPSTRRLAAQLGVHRSTVSLAYQELWALGFLDLRPGACPSVRKRAVLAGPDDRSESPRTNWAALASKPGNTALRDYFRYAAARPAGDPRVVDFSSLEMDHRLFPLESFRASLNRALKIHGGSLFRYGERAGFGPLRETLARRMQSHGMAVRPEEILVTNGSQQGLDLVCRMFAAPGRSAAVESPTYGHILPLLRFHGLKPIEVPIRPGGLDLARLGRVLKDKRPAFVYTMPTFQNPSGITTSQAHREHLLSLCEGAGIPILEDGYDEEMKYFGRIVLPIKSMDRRGLVIYCGTFSKILFPGLRIGWVAADAGCIERLTALRTFSELSPSPLLQAAVREFCENGAYERHIARMHRVFRKRMTAALKALRRRINPEWAEWNEPAGGYLIWLAMKPGPPPGLDWKAGLAAHGVLASPEACSFHRLRRRPTCACPSPPLTKTRSRRASNGWPGLWGRSMRGGIHERNPAFEKQDHLRPRELAAAGALLGHQPSAAGTKVVYLRLPVLPIRLDPAAGGTGSFRRGPRTRRRRTGGRRGALGARSAAGLSDILGKRRTDAPPPVSRNRGDRPAPARSLGAAGQDRAPF
ncbi:MAG: PLP-dependent aminotransferase family protein, partial [Candidatus Aminicenantales bacterium]